MRLIKILLSRLSNDTRFILFIDATSPSYCSLMRVATLVMRVLVQMRALLRACLAPLCWLAHLSPFVHSVILSFYLRHNELGSSFSA